MAEDEKTQYDEEDPEVPVDLFSMWEETGIAEEAQPAADSVAEERASVPEPEFEEPVVDGTLIDHAAVSDDTAHDVGAEVADAVNSEADIADESDDTVSAPESTGPETERAEETAASADTEYAAYALDETARADIAVLEELQSIPEGGFEEPGAVDEPDDAAAPALDAAPESTDVTDDDLDDLIDVPILPLPVESTEITDDDLAFIRAPILSPGDPVSIPNLAVQADFSAPLAEHSSPSIVKLMQEREAVESLGDLTAPKETDPLALFKKLRDLAEELPHNVYTAFKASRMSATLDEIIADFEV